MISKDVILRIIQMKPNLTTFHLMKMAYLFDLAFVQLSGDVRTNFPYRWHYYGPYCEEIEKTAWDLEIEKKIEIKHHVTKKGHECYLYKPLERKRPDLSEIEEKVLKYIINKYAKLDTERLKEFVYSTPPMHAALKKNERFKKLNMKIIPEPYKDFYDQETVKMILDSESSIRKGKTVSIDEVWSKLEEKIKIS